MHDLLVQILKIAEIEIPDAGYRLGRLLKQAPRIEVLGPQPMRRNAVGIDSGIAPVRYLNLNISVIPIAAVGPSVGSKISYAVHIGPKPVRSARLLELAEAGKYHEALVDGPVVTLGLNPPNTRFLAVSKDVSWPGYCVKRRDDVGEWMCKVADLIGERTAASVLLANASTGQYLEPVKLGNVYTTYVKLGSVAVYVEFTHEELLGELAGGYPIQLKLAHRLARVGERLMKNVGSIVSKLLRSAALPRARTLLL